MPVMDGIEATKEIRRLEKASGYIPRTPLGDSRATTPSEIDEDKSNNSPYRSSVIIVALTASSLQSDRVLALGAGCNDFLTKPVSLIWLNSKITEWGSIKALQMWADHGPDFAKTQADKARSVAERLHVPNQRKTPSPSRAGLNLPDEPGPQPAVGTSTSVGIAFTPPPASRQHSSTADDELRLRRISFGTTATRRIETPAPQGEPEAVSSPAETPKPRRGKVSSTVIQG
jgi:osomolarity two-component system, response regulator SSK1